MSNGIDLINAIKANQRIRAVDNCPGVSVAISEAVYGKVKDDNNPIELRTGASEKEIAAVIGFGGANSETAVWHFMTQPIHHFVVVPWYNHQVPQGQAYTVFMAFENQYTVGQYIDNERGHMQRPLVNGYRDLWTPTDLKGMLTALLTTNTAWANYFQYGHNNTVNSIACYKYDIISVDKAVANVNQYR
jgi:hypothetical protein